MEEAVKLLFALSSKLNFTKKRIAPSIGMRYSKETELINHRGVNHIADSSRITFRAGSDCSFPFRSCYFYNSHTALLVHVICLRPYSPSVHEGGGYSDLLIGFVLGSYGFTQMFVRFPLGLLSDKLHKRKPFLMIGMLTGALSCLLFTIPGSWLWPLAGRIMSGVCASSWVAFTVLYAAYFASKDATKAMSNISFMTVTGQLIGMTLSGWLAGAYGWNAAFYAGIALD